MMSKVSQSVLFGTHLPYISRSVKDAELLTLINYVPFFSFLFFFFSVLVLRYLRSVNDYKVTKLVKQYLFGTQVLRHPAPNEGQVHVHCRQSSPCHRPVVDFVSCAGHPHYLPEGKGVAP